MRALEQDCDLEPLGAAVVGGGPAGFGLLLAARSTGQLDQLLDAGLAIIERDQVVGSGELGRYTIRSDSLTESFTRAVEAEGLPYLHGALAAEAGQAMRGFRGQPVPLPVAAEFLRTTALTLRTDLAAQGRDPFRHGVEALDATRTSWGGWNLRCRCAEDGTVSTIRAHRLALATGAEQRLGNLVGVTVGGGALLADHGHKLVLSSRMLSGDAAVMVRLADVDSPRIAIVGGSHSAIACARLLLDGTPGLMLQPGAVTMLHRNPIRLTYQTPAEALADGYRDFGANDLCEKTGRVFPLAGFRADAKELMRRHWNLGGSGPEERLVLHRLDQHPVDETRRILDEADLIVAALGYRPRALPLHDIDGSRLDLAIDAGGALVDDGSRVMGADGSPVPGVFALGLASGYPMADTHGEPSFRGQANGLALWHGAIGAEVVRALTA